MKGKAIKKMAGRFFSLLLALTLCVGAPVSGGTAVYAGEPGSREEAPVSGEEIDGLLPAELEPGTEPAETEPAEGTAEPEKVTGEPEEQEGQDILTPEMGSESAVPEEALPETATPEPLAVELLAAESAGDWAEFADSTWTAAQPIMDEADLAQFSILSQTQDFEGVTVTLGADLDLSAHLWTPIASDRSYAFAGVFDGGNHQIVGLDTGTRSTSAGLFGFIKGSATIKNLRLTVEQVIVVTTTPQMGAGGLVGLVDKGAGGQIFNCQVTVNGTISAGPADQVTKAWLGSGGLVGTDFSDVTIDNCFVHVKPQAVIKNTGGLMMNGNAGGFIGVASYATIKNSKSILEGTLIGEAGAGSTAAVGSTGGFTGWADASKLENCYSISYQTAVYRGIPSDVSKISAASPFCGFTRLNTLVISNCYAIDFGATYDLQSEDKRIAAILAGLVGTEGMSTIRDCYYYMASEAPAYAGKVTATNVVKVETLEAMKKEATYATFDFVDTWTIVEGLNGGYPVLQMELTDQQKTDIVTDLLMAEKSFIVAEGADETVKLAAVQAYVDSVVSGSLFAKAGGVATVAKAGSAYQVTFRLGTAQEQRSIAAVFVQSSQTEEQMMAEAVKAIPAAADLLVTADATQLQKKTAVETYILSLLSPLDFYKANGTYTVTWSAGTTYSVALSLDGVESQTVSIAVTFQEGVKGTVTQTTSGPLLTLFNSTVGYGDANTLIHVAPTTVLAAGKMLVYQNGSTATALYWSSVENGYIGLIPQTGLSDDTIRGNLQIVDGSAASIRYGIVGTGRANRSKIGFADLNYFDKTALIDGAIPEGDVERALAMDVNCDGSLSVSDLMSIIKKYVYNEEFSKAN